MNWSTLQSDGLSEDTAAPAGDQAVDRRGQERVQVAGRGQALQDALLGCHSGMVVDELHIYSLIHGPVFNVGICQTHGNHGGR